MKAKLRLSFRPHGFVAVAALLFAACNRGTAARKQPATPVRVAPVARIDAPIVLNASGVVEPMQTVAVNAQVSGIITDVSFSEGDNVQAGQVLFRLDPRPLQTAVESARANLTRDAAQAEAARREDVRYSELVGKGYVTKSQADQVHATALAADATLDADRAAVHAAELNLAYTTIRAPIAGRTGSLLVRRGNLATSTSGPLVIINQLRPVLIRFPVPAPTFRALERAVGQHPLRVTAMPSDSSRGIEAGTLSFLNNAVDSTSGTIVGKANFPNVSGSLWPGELVFLTVQIETLHNVLAVPTEAVQLGQQGSFVFVIDAKNTAQPRNVKPGITTGDWTVIASGLALKEQVVIDGQSRLNAGAKVAIVRTKPVETAVKQGSS
jgi:membrane fusion protein, multidrug efflux system